MHSDTDTEFYQPVGEVKRFALVDSTGLVVNIIVADDTFKVNLPQYQFIEIGDMIASPGDQWDGATFIRANI